MNSKATITIVSLLLASSLTLGQAPAPQQPQRGTPPAQGAQGPGARGQQADQPEREYTITAIPGVIAAGVKWTQVFEQMGNNGDGIIAAQDGSLLIGQNDNSQVIRLDRDDRSSVLHRDTGSAGALSMDSKGRLFGVQRDTPDRGIIMIAPERKVLANTFQGKPMTELGRINDLVADSKGGVYFTVGQAYYVNPNGEVTRLSEDLRTNGIVLSPDERVLYITNGPVVVAYDVQADGKVGNRRDFARLEGNANGDGLAVDSEGRLYVTANPPGQSTFAPGIQVFDRTGKYLGLIPTPRGPISAAFAGADRKTMYFVSAGATNARPARVYKIPMLATGIKNRGK